MADFIEAVEYLFSPEVEGTPYRCWHDEKVRFLGFSASALKRLNLPWQQEFRKSLTKEKAAGLHKVYHWDANRCGEIDNQKLAMVYFMAAASLTQRNLYNEYLKLAIHDVTMQPVDFSASRLDDHAIQQINSIKDDSLLRQYVMYVWGWYQQATARGEIRNREEMMRRFAKKSLAFLGDEAYTESELVASVR